MDYLFGENDLEHQLSERQRRATSKIDAISKDSFLVSSHREIIDHDQDEG